MTRRIALVTGGVGGIGTAICKRLANDGHFVVANYAIPGTETRWQKDMSAAGLNGTSSALAFGDVTDDLLLRAPKARQAEHVVEHGEGAGPDIGLLVAGSRTGHARENIR